MEVEAVQAAAQDVAAGQAAAAEELFTDVDVLCEQAAAFLAELVKQVRCRAAYAAPWACQRIAGMCPAAVSVLTLEKLPTSRVPIHHPSTRNTAQGDEADRHKLRTAALKLRLAQLAKERRAREAADAAAFQARQRELDR